MKTISQWLKETQLRLEQAGIGTTRLDALVLLEDVLAKDRSWLLANPAFHVDDKSFHKLEELTTRRENHEPLAYIRERSEFYGREFYINHSVLVPRPETETMIELLKQLPLPPKPTIADVGSGSGAIGITVAHELPEATIDLIELDSNALEISQKNALSHNVTVSCIQSNLLEDVQARYDAVLANLPYVPEDYEINQAAEHEPAMALFGGFDGLDLYHTMFGQLAEHINDNGFVLTESLLFQHLKLEKLAKTFDFELYQTEGLIQVFQKNS